MCQDGLASSPVIPEIKKQNDIQPWRRKAADQELEGKDSARHSKTGLFPPGPAGKGTTCRDDTGQEIVGVAIKSCPFDP